MAAKLVLDGLISAHPSQERDCNDKYNVVCVYDVGFGPEEIEGIRRNARAAIAKATGNQ